jgi:ubiquinone/menaquinone biosynthesis C-methylase UbiE
MVEKSQYIKKQIQNWNEIAKSQEARDSTHPDEYLATLELDFLKSKIKGKVLNVGCGSGGETNSCSEKTGIPASGIDVSDKMIEIAQKRFPDLRFEVGNILNLPFHDHFFDSITTRRTLINLLTHEDQVQAIEEMKRVLKQEGNLVIIEATCEGYDRLNHLRHELGLPRIDVVEYNLPLKEEDIINALPGCEISWLNTYYYLTRVYYPLVEKEIRYNTQFHKAAYLLQNKMDIPFRCSPHILVNWNK